MSKKEVDGPNSADQKLNQQNSESFFPDPRQADENGIVAAGGDYSVALLKDAYAHGIFPWPHEGYPLLWFSPRQRGVIDFKSLHISKSLAKKLKKNEYQFTWNTNFLKVVEQCSKQPRKGQQGTWITKELLEGYYEFHKAGFAHSLECWKGADLVGGIYGVDVQGVFSGESMFGLESDVSKICLVKLIESLRAFGHTWMDTQMVTPVVGSMGGRVISNVEFFERLKDLGISGRRLQFS